MKRYADSGNAGMVSRLVRGTVAGLAALVLAGTLAQPATAQKLTVSDVTVTEGGYAIFKLRLSTPVDYAIRYFYFTRAGTAAAGKDYRHTSGTVYIRPGKWSRSVVTVKTETDYRATEGDEHFFLDFKGLHTLGRKPGVYTWFPDTGTGLPGSLTARATIKNKFNSPSGGHPASGNCFPRARAYGFC